MELSGFWPVFLAGSFGGALAELAKWYGMRENKNMPTYVRSVVYWATTAAMVLCGGLMASLYGFQRVTAVLAMNVGASAPLIIASFAKATPVTSGEPRRGVQRQPAWRLVADILAGR